MKQYTVISTTIGPITLLAREDGLTGLHFGLWQEPDAVAGENALLLEAERQLNEYLKGARREFSLPLRPEGTRFQQKVWAALTGIPYGQTRTYGQIAAQIGSPKAARAVGMANHVNPISIIIPCHRVVGANGTLTGYAGGLERKKALLELENSYKP